MGINVPTWSPGWSHVIRAAPELGAFAVAPFQVGSLGGLDVVWTAAEFRSQAAAFAVGSVGGVEQIWAAAPSGVRARRRLLAAFEVGALRLGLPIRAAAVLLYYGR